MAGDRPCACCPHGKVEECLKWEMSRLLAVVMKNVSGNRDGMKGVLSQCVMQRRAWLMESPEITVRNKIAIGTPEVWFGLGTSIWWRSHVVSGRVTLDWVDVEMFLYFMGCGLEEESVLLWEYQVISLSPRKIYVNQHWSLNSSLPNVQMTQKTFLDSKILEGLTCTFKLFFSLILLFILIEHLYAR